MARDYLNQAIDIIKKERRLIALIMSAIFVLLAASLLRSFAYMNTYTNAFAAGTAKDSPLYVIGRPLGDPGDAGEGEEAGPEGLIAKENGRRIVRGTPLRRYSETEVVGGETYVRVAESPGSLDEVFEDPGFAVYIKESNLAASKDDVVREKEVYVRTPVTIYKEAKGPAIASFAAKGSKLSVTGYDRIDEAGSVNKYRVSYGSGEESSEGYVYGKYVAGSQEAANAVYNENGIYDKAVKDRFSFNLHGGKASNLDYYPYERLPIAGNEFCSDARAMYLNCEAVVKPKAYIDLIKGSDCNAVVADIKDGVMAYKSDVAKEWSPRSYKTAYASAEDYKKGIDAIRETGVYMIGRIVVFNDPIYAKDHPEDCIKYGKSTNWPSAYSRDVWEYNVRLAVEAIEKFGFNEIQFDYVRFPEASYEMSASGANFRNAYNEEKGQAVQNFCFYAADQIREAGAYFSVDVFGESAYGYMTAYGQYWPGIANIADAISAMPYTDHMGADGAWENPYATVKAWAKKAKKMQDRLEHPAAARTWITGYDTPHWAPSVSYGNKKLKDQVRALREEGLDGGFIPWNSASEIANYKKYKKVWNID